LLLAYSILNILKLLILIIEFVKSILIKNSCKLIIV
jgi:hypothetical protein